jgi:hypothetical protein
MNDEPRQYERQMNPGWAVNAAPGNFRRRGTEALDRVFSDLTEWVRRLASVLHTLHQGSTP